MRRWVAGMAVLLAASAAAAQGRTLAFSLDRAGPPAEQYTISLAEDGVGTYAPQAGGESKPMRVRPELAKKLFAAVPMVEGGRCETHNKNIAQTGVKVLRYAGAGREAQCTYNYSDDDRVNEATMAFEALAATMEYGERLRAKLRFDRLGLDAELDGLHGAVEDGRALEVGNIAPVLKAISDDERVMERARRRAERLLADSGQTAAGEGSSAR